ncbi:MAG TPA: crosslink repair DNA glycosylase YcaQ family protein, partial [Candidatus Saccharimonadia bacterium]|nr:crosslink repair DNA glycosylase YcaQ family protein [Candidatus Saccharimonadia bacterium]
KGERFVVSDELPLLDQAEREVASGLPPNRQPPGVAFLAPLDPLVWDRQLLRPLFGFDYVWEVYVPASKRRWGYYVLPIWFADRIVGRIEPRIDRRAKALRVLGIWWEDGFDPLAEDGFVDAFVDALEALRRFGDAKTVRLPRLARHRSFASAVRASLGVERAESAE